MMTVDEVAQYLRLKKPTVQAKVRRGEIPYTRLGKQVVFLRHFIDMWLALMTRGPMVEEIRSRLLGPAGVAPLGSPGFPLTLRERQLLAKSEKDAREGRVVPFPEE